MQVILKYRMAVSKTKMQARNKLAPPQAQGLSEEQDLKRKWSGERE